MFFFPQDHDYCYAAFSAAQPTEDLSEMGKILSDVALGAAEPVSTAPRERPTGLLKLASVTNLAVNM